MPRNTRNFWIELQVDGHKQIATGPRSKDGGFEMTIKLRENGEISRQQLTITGYVEDGKVCLDAVTTIDDSFCSGEIINTTETLHIHRNR